jgi:stearoyl-CoA desaturase (delta-9 desaturase)
LPLMTPFQSWQKYYNNSRLLSSPFWVVASPWQWIKAQVTPYINLEKRAMVNMILIYAFVCIFFPLMALNLGWWGLVKYYLMPWLVYHFWASSFQKAHQLPHVALLKLASERYEEYKETVQKTKEQLKNEISVTFAVKFPKWVELLSDNFNYMVVDNIAVPNYNIKSAYKHLQEKFDKRLQETSLTKFIFSNDDTGLSVKTVAEKVDWFVTAWLFGSIFLAFIGFFVCEVHAKTLLLGFILYYLGGIGITSGYHRLWSHRSFDAKGIAKIPLMLAGSSTFEGSVISWCRDHRAHHRYTDTNKDPYNAKRGFWYSHMGWLIWKRDSWGTEYYTEAEVDISDLVADPILTFQHKYYPYFALGLGIVMPTLIAGLGWGDWLGGLFIGGFAKAVFIQHATFFINSLAHWWGDFTYSDQRTPRDSYLVSLFTFGEGYHNFHHEFPYDYRNGLRWMHYDPGKWLISFLGYFGIAYNLKRFKPDLFEKGVIQMKQKRIDEQKTKYSWGKSVDELPDMSLQQFKSRCAEGAHLIVVDGLVHEVTDFINEHPGGRALIKAYVGKDATLPFNETVYNHSQAARNELANLRVAKLVSEEEYRKKTL